MPLIITLILVLSGLSVLTLIAPYDLDLITYFSEHRIEWFIEIMSESIFELEKPGGGDIVVLFYVVTLILYLASSLLETKMIEFKLLFYIQRWLHQHSRFSDFIRAHRLQLEFLVVSSFCTSTLMVKTLKWTMARPRPKKILRGTREFYHWYETGPYFLDEGMYRASFPSGHTASAITLIGLAYLLLYGTDSKKWNARGKIIVVMVLLFTAMMAAARVMTTAHWPTDVIFSIFGGWLIIHVLFFHVYQMGSSHSKTVTRSAAIGAPPFRGILICGYLSLLCLSVVIMVIGLRHYLHSRWPWMILLSLPAIALAGYASRKVIQHWSRRF